eukprot:2553066-Ditylum_brightwellii.AAC.1
MTSNVVIKKVDVAVNFTGLSPLFWQHSLFRIWRKLDNITVVTANVSLAFSNCIIYSNPDNCLVEEVSDVVDTTKT